MQRFISVRAAVFNYYWSCISGGVHKTVVALPCPLGKEMQPIAVGNLEVKEALDDVVARHLGQGGLDSLADFGSHGFGALAGLFDVGENDERIVAAEVATRVLQRYAGRRLFHSIEIFEGPGDGPCQ